jgi:hypothetical protein
MASFIMAFRCRSVKTKSSTTISTGNSTGSMTLIVILMSMDAIWLSSLQIMPKRNLAEIEDFFDYTLEKRMIFIIYNKNAEYKQSNIGLVTFDEDSYNTGGFNRIIKNKVMLYYEGDHETI